MVGPQTLSETSAQVLEMADQWQAAGRHVAIATVVATWGSSPRPVGSQLLVDEQGEFLGSVSGGCIEGAVVGEALEVIASGRPRLLDFGVSDETAWEAGLSCGGKVQVYVEPLES
jgi:xanthine/CO dehydrogenase XdhC/CoxF family maturation factor